MIDNPVLIHAHASSIPYPFLSFWGFKIQMLIRYSNFTEFKDDLEIYFYPNFKYVDIEL